MVCVRVNGVIASETCFPFFFFFRCYINDSTSLFFSACQYCIVSWSRYYYYCCYYYYYYYYECTPVYDVCVRRSKSSFARFILIMFYKMKNSWPYFFGFTIIDQLEICFYRWILLTEVFGMDQRALPLCSFLHFASHSALS